MDPFADPSLHAGIEVVETSLGGPWGRFYGGRIAIEASIADHLDKLASLWHELGHEIDCGLVGEPRWIQLPKVVRELHAEQVTLVLCAHQTLDIVMNCVRVLEFPKWTELALVVLNMTAGCYKIEP